MSALVGRARRVGLVTQKGARFSTETHGKGIREGRRKKRRGEVGSYRGEGVRGVGSHYVEGGDVTDGDGWLHVRQV